MLTRDEDLFTPQREETTRLTDAPRTLYVNPEPTARSTGNGPEFSWVGKRKTLPTRDRVRYGLTLSKHPWAHADTWGRPAHRAVHRHQHLQAGERFPVWGVERHSICTPRRHRSCQRTGPQPWAR